MPGKYPVPFQKKANLPIHYALEITALTAKAKRTIDRYVLKVLEDDLNAIVEIGSHTDAQGSDQFNLTLSENRAKNVVEYLISKGVDSSRLIGMVMVKPNY